MMPQTEPRTHPSRRGAIDTIVSLMAAGYLLLDFFWQTVLGERAPPALVSLVFGIVMAQYNLLAIWAVLGTQPWYVRQPGAYLGVLASYVCMLLGAKSDHDLLDEMHISFMLPLLFLCFQAPLLAARFALRWRVVSDDNRETDSDNETRRFSLSQLLAATTIIAIAIAPVRWLDSKGFDVLALGALAAGLGLFVTLPSAWAALGARNRTGATVVLILYATGPAVLASIAHLIVEPISDSLGEVIAMFGALPITFVGTTYFVLVAIHNQGYSLRAGRPGAR